MPRSHLRPQARHARAACHAFPPAVYSFSPASMSALCFRTEARPWPASRPAARWCCQGAPVWAWGGPPSGHSHSENAWQRHCCSQTCSCSCDEAPHGRLVRLALRGGWLRERWRRRSAAVGLHGKAADGSGRSTGGRASCLGPWASVRLGLGLLRHPALGRSTVVQQLAGGCSSLTCGTRCMPGLAMPTFSGAAAVRRGAE